MNYRVTWTDAKNGGQHEYRGDQSDCRQVFPMIVRAAIRGEYSDVILWDPNGNAMDTWGT